MGCLGFFFRVFWLRIWVFFLIYEGKKRPKKKPQSLTQRHTASARHTRQATTATSTRAVGAKSAHPKYAHQGTATAGHGHSRLSDTGQKL